MAIVPKDWMPNCSMKRIILHWTAGEHRASSIDLAHYHILIEADGKLVRGTHSIKDNVSTADNIYAAHTFRLNTGSIGVSVCCMGGAKERPFHPGNSPMTEKQWKTMAQVVAELCQFYDIPVTQKTVLGHGEVTTHLGKDQSGKWDVMVLPWNLSLNKTEVGNLFRSMVKKKIEGSSNMQETPASITVVIKNKTFREAQIFNEKSRVKLRPVVEGLNLTITHANKDGVELSVPGNQPSFIPYKLIDHGNQIMSIPANTPEAEIVDRINKFGFVAATDLGKMFNLPVNWNGTTRTVTIG
jgi:N-acetyl-anhydromuramyl-L-alanine amidase AmpD